MTSKEYEEILKNKLSKQRYYHSICVAEQAVKLAKLKGANEDKAHLAGLLHDICKEESTQSLLQYLNSHDILLNAPLMDNSFVWHGIAGSIYIKEEFNISDEEVLNAVYYHTTAKPEMSLLEEIIFLADYTSDDRDYPSCNMMRELVLTDWNKAMVEGLRFGMGQGLKHETALILDSVNAYNYYLSKMNRKQV